MPSDSVGNGDLENGDMAKQPKRKADDDKPATMDQLNEALKTMLSTPHETHKEMVERRRRQGMRSVKRPSKK